MSKPRAVSAKVETKHPESYVLVDVRGNAWVIDPERSWVTAPIEQVRAARDLLDRMVRSVRPDQ